MDTLVPRLPVLEDQLAAVKKSLGVAILVIVILALLLAFSLITAVRLSARIGEVAVARPIYVIPGAAEGVYAPGLTQTNLLNAARYVASLAANLNAANAAARLSELERYCTPEFASRFVAEKERLLKEILAQAQSRALQPERGETLVHDERQGYTYTVTGVWEIKSGAVLMSEERHRFVMRFTVGNPDKENPHGIWLQAFDVTPLGPVGGAPRALGPTPLRAGAG